MSKATRAALIAASIVYAHGATAAATVDPRSFDPPPRIASNAPLATHPIADPSRVVTAGAAHAGPAAAHAESRVKNKRDSSSLPGSDAFVLLGMGIVLVGVLARRKRGFRRSGTILLR